MATIPIYQQQVDAKPTPGFRQESVATPGLLGGAADTLVQAGKSMAAIGGQLELAQERQDMTAVLSVEAARKEKMISFDAEMRKTRAGGNAEGATQYVKQWWDGAAKEDTANLNDTQRAVYQRRMAATRLEHIHTSSQFEAHQLDQYLGDTTKAAVVSATNTAAANAFNKEAGKVDEVSIALQDEAIVTALTALAKRKGEAKKGPNGEPSPLEVAIGEARTRMHKEVLQALPPEHARDYFNAHEKEIDGSQRDSLGKAARAQTADALGRNAAKEEIAAAGGYGAGADVIFERLDKRFGSDTVTLKAAHQAASEMIGAFKDGEKTRLGATEAAVQRRLLQGESWAVVKQGPEFKKLTYDSGPTGADIASRLSAQEDQRAATRASRAASESSRSYTEAAHRQIDLGKAGQNEYLSLILDPEKLAAVPDNDLINARSRMNDQQVHDLVTRKLQLTKGADALNAAKLDANTAKLVLRSVGLPVDKKPSEMSDDDHRRVEQTTIAAQQALADAGKAKGRAITDPTERYEIAKKAVFDIVRVPGFFFGGTDLPVSALTPAEMAKAVVNTDLGKVELAKIPEDFRKKAAADYEAKGKTLTQRSLARDWLYSNQQEAIKKFKGPTGPYMGGK